MILENLNPRNVFYFFEEICRIPHGSGNTEQISNYLAEFARERNLEYYQDEIGNVIIIKEASAGYEGQCGQCPYLRICRGGCRRHREQGEQGLGLNYFCESYRMFFDACLPRLKEIAAACLRRGL